MYNNSISILGAKKVPGKRGRKRKQTENEAEEPPSKKEHLEKTPIKNSSAAAQNSPAKSPAASGVNRRTAVLFTRKKQAIETSETPEPPEPKSPKPASNKAKKSVPISEESLAQQETEVQSSNEAPSAPSVPEKVPKKRGRKPKAQAIKAPSSSWRGPNAGPSSCSGNASESFRSYRRGGDQIGETDQETESESATDAMITSDDDHPDPDTHGKSGDDDSDADSEAGINLNINLEPLHLV